MVNESIIFTIILHVVPLIFLEKLLCKTTALVSGLGMGWWLFQL